MGSPVQVFIAVERCTVFQVTFSLFPHLTARQQWMEMDTTHMVYIYRIYYMLVTNNNISIDTIARRINTRTRKTNTNKIITRLARNSDGRELNFHSKPNSFQPSPPVRAASKTNNKSLSVCFATAAHYMICVLKQVV